MVTAPTVLRPYDIRVEYTVDNAHARTLFGNAITAHLTRVRSSFPPSQGHPSSVPHHSPTRSCLYLPPAPLTSVRRGVTPLVPTCLLSLSRNSTSRAPMTIILRHYIPNSWTSIVEALFSSPTQQPSSETNLPSSTPPPKHPIVPSPLKEVRHRRRRPTGAVTL